MRIASVEVPSLHSGQGFGLHRASAQDDVQPAVTPCDQRSHGPTITRTCNHPDLRSPGQPAVPEQPTTCAKGSRCRTRHVDVRVTCSGGPPCPPSGHVRRERPDRGRIDAGFVPQPIEERSRHLSRASGAPLTLRHRARSESDTTSVIYGERTSVSSQACSCTSLME
jgi:hypothetical protein